MIEIENLRKRIESVVAECDDIVNLLFSELEGLETDSSVESKDINIMIENFHKRGLTIPDELKNVKQKSVSNENYYNDLIPLADHFLKTVGDIISSEPVKKMKKIIKSNIKRSSNGFNYEKPLGSKGNEQLKDYLIPVINFMIDGDTHTEAFHKVAKIIDVRYNTVSSQCTRGLKLTTDQFNSKVQNGTIKDLLENKFPDRISEIREQIKMK